MHGTGRSLEDVCVPACLEQFIKLFAKFAWQTWQSDSPTGALEWPKIMKYRHLYKSYRIAGK